MCTKRIKYSFINEPTVENVAYFQVKYYDITDFSPSVRLSASQCASTNESIYKLVHRWLLVEVQRRKLRPKL